MRKLSKAAIKQKIALTGTKRLDGGYRLRVQYIEGFDDVMQFDYQEMPSARVGFAIQRALRELVHGGPL